LALALDSAGFSELVQSLYAIKGGTISSGLGQLESVQAVESMVRAGTRIAIDVLAGAAGTCNAGHLTSLWAGVLGRPPLPDDVCFEIGLQAAQWGDSISVLSWLAPQLPTWPPYYVHILCNVAAVHGYVDTLEFLMARGRWLFGDQRALTLSDLADLADRWRSDIGTLIHVDTDGDEHIVALVDAAAAFSDATVLRWLHSRQPLQFTSITMKVAAARGGGLPTLKWLYAQGCPHDINEVCEGLMRCNLSGVAPPMLEWVRSCGGGDWSAQGMTSMLVEALAHMTPTLARWLRAEGAQWPADLSDVVVAKVDSVHPRNLLWAIQQGCPFGRWTFELSTPVERALVEFNLGGCAVYATVEIVVTPPPPRPSPPPPVAVSSVMLVLHLCIDGIPHAT
ncbi:hypothetical protein JKP88DRAFT_256015, partial [Tribonema minus]